jgi:uncharacterized protein (TIGR02246 family)
LPTIAQRQEKHADGQRISEVLERFTKPTAAGDKQAMDSLFTADVDMLDVDGSFRRGRDSVVDHLLKLGRGRGISQRMPTRLVGEKTALVEGSGRRAADGRESWAMLVLTYTTDGWKIAAVRVLATPPVKLP